jgi:hypothetical protein
VHLFGVCFCTKEIISVHIVSSPPKSLTISGAPVRGHADFPAEAVQSFHEKPVPTHDSRHVTKPTVIHQPRK